LRRKERRPECVSSCWLWSPALLLVAQRATVCAVGPRTPSGTRALLELFQDASAQRQMVQTPWLLTQPSNLTVRRGWTQRQIAQTAGLLTQPPNLTAPRALTPLAPCLVMIFRSRRWMEFAGSLMTPVNQTKTAQRSSSGTSVWSDAGSRPIFRAPLRSRTRWTTCANHSSLRNAKPPSCRAILSMPRVVWPEFAKRGLEVTEQGHEILKDGFPLESETPRARGSARCPVGLKWGQRRPIDQGDKT